MNGLLLLLLYLFGHAAAWKVLVLQNTKHSSVSCSASRCLGWDEDISALDLSVFQDYSAQFGLSSVSFEVLDTSYPITYTQLKRYNADAIFIPGGRTDTYCFSDSSVKALTTFAEEGHDIILTGMGKIDKRFPLATTNQPDLSWASDSQQILWYSRTSSCNVNLAPLFGLKMGDSVHIKAHGNSPKDLVFKKVRDSPITQDFPEEIAYSTLWSSLPSSGRWNQQMLDDNVEVVLQADDYEHIVSIYDHGNFRASFFSNEGLDVYSMRRGTQYLRKKAMYNALTMADGKFLGLLEAERVVETLLIGPSWYADPFNEHGGEQSGDFGRDSDNYWWHINHSQDWRFFGNVRFHVVTPPLDFTGLQWSFTWEDLVQSEAEVVVLGGACYWFQQMSEAQVEALAAFMQQGKGIVGLYGALQSQYNPNGCPNHAPLNRFFGLADNIHLDEGASFGDHYSWKSFASGRTKYNFDLKYEEHGYNFWSYNYVDNSEQQWTQQDFLPRANIMYYGNFGGSNSSGIIESNYRTEDFSSVYTSVSLVDEPVLPAAQQMYNALLFVTNSKPHNPQFKILEKTASEKVVHLLWKQWMGLSTGLLSAIALLVAAAFLAIRRRRMDPERIPLLS